MKIKDVMTPHVETVSPTTTIEKAASLMSELEIGVLPVMEDHLLVGIVTDRDITTRATSKGLNPDKTPVSSVMTDTAVFCYDDQTVAQGAALMAKKQVRRLVVLDRTGRLAGIVSVGDLAVDAGDDDMVGDAMEKISMKRKSVDTLYKHILVALDGSKLAEQVLPYVEVLAEKMGSKVTIVRAISPLEAAFMGEVPAGAAVGSPVSHPPITKEMRYDAVNYLTAIQDRLQGAEFGLECEHPEGLAAEVIVQRARHLGADLISMTTHGRTGVKRAIMGSVADEVIRTAPCPVLLVRGIEA